MYCIVFFTIPQYILNYDEFCFYENLEIKSLAIKIFKKSLNKLLRA